MNAFTLKILAIVAMTCNHIARTFFEYIPPQISIILYAIGGMTYPLMAYLLVEGYIHTSNFKKYALRIFIFALISQIPYTLLYGVTANIFFTLFISLFLIYICDKYKGKKYIIIYAIIFIEVISTFCDWVIAGPLIVLIFYYSKKKDNLIYLAISIPLLIYGIPSLFEFINFIINNSDNYNIIISQLNNGKIDGNQYIVLTLFNNNYIFSLYHFDNLCMFMFTIIGPAISILLITIYNGKRGLSIKWLFYVYYPLHLMIIYIIKHFLL